MYQGIDLGTSNSAIAVHDGKVAKVISPRDPGPDPDVLPSSILIDKRGRKLYGHRAYEHLFSQPDNATDGFKRQMGTSWVKKFADSGIVMTAEECSSEILKVLVGQVEGAGSAEDVEGTVITIPAAFNQMQIEATMRAASNAGIEKTALLQEPVAAAMATVASIANKNGQFLIYDLGGGTFDLALVQSLNNKITVVAHEGINALGGRDFDRLIINNVVRPWLLNNFALPENFQKEQRYRRLIRVCHKPVEDAKKEISDRTDATIYFPDERVMVEDDAGNPIYFEIEMTRSEYESLIIDKIKDTVDLSRKMLDENGYSHEDIDKIVYIGGPTKTPLIRDMVSHEMGIPGSTELNPMTAVAIGAAYFSEGLDWSLETVSRKSVRGSKQVSADAGIRYDFPLRTSDDRARVRVSVSDDAVQRGLEVEINSEQGWTSGRRNLSEKIVIEVPLDQTGENEFRVMIFDSAGHLVESDCTMLSITRTAAMADSLRLTYTIAVEIRDEEGSDASNVLAALAEKGTLLPCEGVARHFRSAIDLSEPGKKLSINLYEQPDRANTVPGEPNLYLGSVQIGHENINQIRVGDEIIIHSKIDESQIVAIEVEVPSLKQTFTGQFYSSKAGERTYGGEEGFALINSMLASCKKELKDAKKALSDAHTAELRKFQNKIEQLSAKLESSSDDAEERRAIAEEIRSVHQSVRSLHRSPENRISVLQQELKDAIERFDSLGREMCDRTQAERFDDLAEKCRAALKRGGDNDRKDAKRMIEEMEGITAQGMFAHPGVLVELFKQLSNERHLALDKQGFDATVEKGRASLANNDIQGLRQAIGELFANRIESGGPAQSSKQLADLMKR